MVVDVVGDEVRLKVVEVEEIEDLELSCIDLCDCQAFYPLRIARMKKRMRRTSMMWSRLDQMMMRKQENSLDKEVLMLLRRECRKEVQVKRRRTKV